MNSDCSDQYTVAKTYEMTYETCQNKRCVLQSNPQVFQLKCEKPNHYCQDGHCGCSEGFEACEPLKKCVKKKDINLNELCGCDFQCEEGFCDDTAGRCVKGLNVKLSSSKSILKVGDETTLSLSVTNPLNKDVEADITLKLGDGVELTEVLSGDQCGGSQCKLDKKIIPAGGKKDVIIKVKATSDIVASSISAFVHYQLKGGKSFELQDKTSIKIIRCGNGKVEEGETSETCCIDAGCPADNRIYSFTCNKKTEFCNKSLHSYYIYGGVGALLSVFLIVFGISKAVKHHKKVSPKKDKKKKAKKEKQKERIKKRTLKKKA